MLVLFIVFRIIILFFEIFHISLEGLRFSFSMYQWVAPQLSVLFNLSQNIVCEGGGFCLASLSLILVTGALIPFVGSTLQNNGLLRGLNERAS